MATENSYRLRILDIVTRDMSRVMRKPVFVVSAQVRHSHRRWLEAENFGFRKKRDCTFTIYVAKTKALICAFVFPYTNSRFSHDTAHTI